TLRSVETVIVDEVHAVAGNKRGAHLALSLERLDALTTSQGGERPQRVGLSATVRPVDAVAGYLGGSSRRVTIVQPPSAKRLELNVVVPVEDMTDLETAAGTADEQDPVARRSIWPHVEERVLDLIQAHRSTIVFANSRRLAERLCGRLNELATERAFVTAGADGGPPAARPGWENSAGGGDGARAGSSSAMGAGFLPQGAGGSYDVGTGAGDGTVVIAR